MSWGRANGKIRDLAEPELGYDVPALPAMALNAVQTPALVVDLDAFKRNLDRMRD